MRVDDAGMIELGGHQPGTGLHAYVVGSGPPFMSYASHRLVTGAAFEVSEYPDEGTGQPARRSAG